MGVGNEFIYSETGAAVWGRAPGQSPPADGGTVEGLPAPSSVCWGSQVLRSSETQFPLCGHELCSPQQFKLRFYRQMRNSK